MPTKYDRRKFFEYVRNAPFGGKLTQQQVDGMNDMLDYIEHNATYSEDDRKVAWTFANTFWETGARMVPVRETFANSTRQAIARLDAAWKAGRLPQVRTPYWREGWFGRGRTQTTHEANYRKVERFSGRPVHSNPDLLLKSEIDVIPSIGGLYHGLFTGKRLGDYFNSTDNDPVNARRVVNGTDKAKHIAENLYTPFLAAVKAAREEVEAVLPDVPEEPDVLPPRRPEGIADGKPAVKSQTLWAALSTAVAGGGASVLAAIDNPYALGFGVVCVLAAAWIIRERLRHRYEDGV